MIAVLDMGEKRCNRWGDHMFTPQAIPGVLLVQPKRFGDARGYFSETFNSARYVEVGIPDFVQDNESLSRIAGTVRGLHFQKVPFAQAKLVRCTRGSFFDAAVDIRRKSPTYGKHVAVTLSAENGLQLYVPVGFAHGFCTLEPDTQIEYKVSAPYSAEHDGGLAWDDPALNINWPVEPAKAILSDKDRRQPKLADLPDLFAYLA
ncbi:dTDP-4-dehydrorhamnose 3,5-epimerase [uncultured Defluviicoccus sp.]|uniref:dTDP-4-dehydrorhamnose 3,5-epimerase n=1 Tax=metagenome TaxID=256318 RepID=A0A380TCU7_9ZZZZ|nr:dTDP-4-dehydrorhamnose 3,5-epimerase [uncultured Defluviicoccus sp.]